MRPKSPNAKDEILIIRLTAAEKAALAETASRAGRTVSDLTRELIRQAATTTKPAEQRSR